MATLKLSLTMATLAGWFLLGCGKLTGLDTSITPLAQIQVQVTDDNGVLQQQPNANLRVALVWGAQWLPEPFCELPPERLATLLPGESTPAAVIDQGCPDNFRFVPNRAGPDIPIQPGVTATITLVTLPGADVMVGDITSRVAYASLVVYDDRNGNGALDFHHPPRHRHGQFVTTDDAGVDDAGAATRDFVYNASFISMTKPDQRLAYLEGTFNPAAAFYPRPGCDAPLPAFSILSAGGFYFPPPDFVTIADVLRLLSGNLPDEQSCGAAQLSDAVVSIPLAPTNPGDAGAGSAPAGLPYFACTANDSGGTTYYLEPPAAEPDWANITWACVDFPAIPHDDAGVANGQQLVIASAPEAACQSVAHYTLRGCDTDPSCAAPSWDLTANPPSWWPCLTTP